nr:cupin domain-containing protein [Streptomyces marincola]
MPEPYTLADDPATPPSITIAPEQRCSTTTTGRDVAQSMSLGVRTRGESAARRVDRAAQRHLTGAQRGRAQAAHQSARDAPVQPASAVRTPLIGMLAAEVGKEDIGQDAVLDRLLDPLPRVTASIISPTIEATRATTSPASALRCSLA